METIKKETVDNEENNVEKVDNVESQKKQEQIKTNRAQKRRIIFSKPTKNLIFNQIITMRSIIQKDFEECVKYFKFVNLPELHNYTKNDLRFIKNKYMKFLRYTEELAMSKNKYSKKELNAMALNYARKLHN